MKKIIFLTFITLFIYTESFSQEDHSYAIVRVQRSKGMIGDYKINIYYGNDSVVEYNIARKRRLDNDHLPTYEVEALNYMEKQGYELKNVVNFSLAAIETEYIFRKKEE